MIINDPNVAGTKVGETNPNFNQPSQPLKSIPSVDAYIAANPGPTPQATTQPQPTETTQSPYYPRYSSHSIQEQPPAPVKSTEQIQEEMTRAAQGEINALGEYYNQRLTEQKIINDQNDRSTASVNTLTGLSGSDEANTKQRATTTIGQNANSKIMAEKTTAIQGILSGIRKSAIEESKYLREEARLDEQTREARRAKRQEEANKHIINIAASGITFDGLKKTDPAGFEFLVKQFGNEAALKGAFVLNTPADQVLDKRLEGNRYIIARQNPLTGKISVETTELDIPIGYDKTIDAGDRIIAVPNNWDGDTSKLVSINKGLTPTQSTKTTGGGGTTGGSTGGANLSGLAKAVQSGLIKISDLTPTQRGAVASELSAAGITDVGSSVEIATSALTSAQDLLNKFETDGKFAVGKSSIFGTVPGTKSRDFVKTFNNLKALLSLDAIQYLKGTGALSDAEQAMLASAASSLSRDQSEAEFKKTLENLIPILTKTSKGGVTAPTNTGTPQGTNDPLGIF